MSELIATDPAHDAFARWWAEGNNGALPAPADVKEILPIFLRRRLHLPEERYVERALAVSLAQGCPEAGIPPYDPTAEIEAAAHVGVDLLKDPHFLKLAELAELGRQELRHKERDPRKADRAKSRKIEKALRRRAATAKRKHSKVLRRSSARDPERDRNILREIHDFLKVHLPVRLVSDRRHLVSPPPFSPASAPRSTTHDHVIWTPNWQKASLPLRAMAIGIAAGNMGARDFTLHLGDSGIAYGMGVGEMKFAQRLYRKIRDALELQCPRQGYPAPEFFFVVEKGIGERPHLHGASITPDKRSHREHLSELLLDTIGRDWLPSPDAHTQLEFGSLYEPVGWIDYILKYTDLTKHELGNNIFACSRELTQIGTRWYDHMRKSGDLLFPGKAVPVAFRP